MFDLLHVLFGTILAIDDPALLLVAGHCHRDPGRHRAGLSAAGAGVLRPGLPALGRCAGAARVHALFLTLVVLNLVAGFQALGTLMAVGLMMLPAAAARFWAREVWSLGPRSAS